MQRYKVAAQRAVFDVEPGEEFERELSPSEEADMLASGRLEIVPRKYRVLSRNFTGGEAGKEIEAAYPVEIERTLIEGGHIERVDKKTRQPKNSGEEA